MTVATENESSDEYNQIRFVEFLEFLGRLAYFKFKETDKHETYSMDTKLLHLLNAVLPIINEKAINPADNNLLESDSDDDYWREQSKN